MLALFNLIELKNYIVTEDPFMSTDRELIRRMDEYYDPDLIKYFYPRNMYKNEEVEYLIFYTDGYSIVSSKQGVANHITFNAKLISKQFTKPRTPQRNHILILTYDNGETLTLESNVDAEPEWYEEYGKQLIEMYKYL